jgi:hypothetical protein
MKVPFGIYLAFSFALYCWHIATFVLGVFLAEYFDVSDTGFDLKSDIKKAAVCSCINDCQKKRDQRLVKNIQINGKTCCASWENINS